LQRTCSACSSECRSFIRDPAKLGCSLLLELATARIGVGQQEQYKSAVVWLASVTRAAPHAAAVVAEQLLSMPSIPMEWAARLVSAGMRITYAQLLSAANMVACVEQ
jgi:hypothetical protein